MKEAVDPRSAEGRELQDLLQSQILQIVKTLRKTNLRRENRANLKQQKAERIQELEALGVQTKVQRDGTHVFTPVATGTGADLNPDITVRSVIHPSKTLKLGALTVPVRLDDLATNGCCKALIVKDGGLCVRLREPIVRFFPSAK